MEIRGRYVSQRAGLSSISILRLIGLGKTHLKWQVKELPYSLNVHILTIQNRDSIFQTSLGLEERGLDVYLREYSITFGNSDEHRFFS